MSQINIISLYRSYIIIDVVDDTISELTNVDFWVIRHDRSRRPSETIAWKEVYFKQNKIISANNSH